MKKPIRIIEILPDQNDACSLYRGAGPNSLLEKTYPEIQFLGYPWNKALEWSNISRADIVFMQRPHSEIAVNTMMNCFQLGVPTWIDYDDLLTNIPADNPNAEGYVKYKRTLEFLIKNATVVTASTHQLCESLYFRKKRIEHIPNALPHFLTLPDKPAISADIFWRGNMTHLEDLHEHAEPIIMACNEKNLQISFMGYHPTAMRKAIARTAHYPPTSLMQYFDMMKQRVWGIIVVPLCGNEFNMCKSNIAWIEATYAGAITIAPNFEEWSMPGVVQYQSSGHLYELLSFYGGNSEEAAAERIKLWNLSASYINERLTLKEVNKMRYELIKSIV